LDRLPAPPAAAVFDNDGLLLDTEDTWTRAEVVLFATHGRTFTPEHKRDLVGTSHLIAATKLEAMLDLPGQGHALVEELQAMVREGAAKDGVEPRPGAVALVDALRAAGVPVALASNSERAFVDLVLRSSGMADRFEVVVAGDEVAAPKPAPDIYVEACRRLGVAPADAVALEDSPTGIAAARAAGMRVIGVPFLEDITLDADVVAPSLASPEVYDALGLTVSEGSASP
jgi:HAD superfamily hydrolase (TIGR01509 family)